MVILLPELFRSEDENKRLRRINKRISESKCRVGVRPFEGARGRDFKRQKDIYPGADSVDRKQILLQGNATQIDAAWRPI